MAIKAVNDCEHQAEHPLIDRRLTALEEWREGVERERMSDFRAITTQLGEVHEKINAVAVNVAGMLAARTEVRADRSGWVSAMSAATAVIALIYSIIFRK